MGSLQQSYLFVFLLGLPSCSAHGQMTYPGSSRMGGSIELGGDCDKSIGSCYWFTNNVKIPGEPTLKQTFRSINVDSTEGRLDWTHKNPWRAPGTAPVFGHGCGVAGGGNTLYANGGWPPKGISQGLDGLDMPKKKSVVWTPGSTQEVGISVSANHAGGYSWRLCKNVEGQVSEECFQKTSLKFAGNKQYFVYTDGSWSEIPLTKTNEGTYPTGSEWARFPVPTCNECNPVDKCGEPIDPMPGDGGGEWNLQVNCNAACYGSTSSKQDGTCADKTSFPVALSGASGYGKSIWDWSIVDKVLIPEDLEEGDYLLSLRWDAEQSDQVFQNCADITLKIGGSSPPTLLNASKRLSAYRVKARERKEPGSFLRQETSQEEEEELKDTDPGWICYELGVEKCDTIAECAMLEKGGCWTKPGTKGPKGDSPGPPKSMSKDTKKTTSKDTKKTPKGDSPKETPKGDSSNTGKSAGDKSSVTTKVVSMEFTMKGIVYDKLKGDTVAMETLQNRVKASVLDNLPSSAEGYTEDDMKVTLSAGSVKATVEITPTSSDNLANLKKAVSVQKDAIADATLKSVKEMPNLTSFLEDGKNVQDLTLSYTNPVEAEPEPEPEPEPESTTPQQPEERSATTHDGTGILNATPSTDSTSSKARTAAMGAVVALGLFLSLSS